MSNSTSERNSFLDFSDANRLARLVWLVAGAALVILLAFAGYYYWDRYIHVGDLSPIERGAQHLEEIVRERPDEVEPRIALAQYYLDANDYEQAIDQTVQILAVYTDSAPSMYIQGLAYLRTDQVDKAEEALARFAGIRRQAATANQDRSLEASLYFLGQIYNDKGDSEMAVSVLTEALAIDRFDADAMYQLGRAYSASAEHELALAQYSNAIRFVPDFAEAYSGMVQSYTAMAMADHATYASGMEAFSLGDYERAGELLKRTVQSLPGFAPGFLGLGLTLEQLGDLDEAEINLQRALDLDHGNYMATHALGRVQQANN